MYESKLTSQFKKGLKTEYRDRVEWVDREDYGYLVLLTADWHQSDDTIHSVIGVTMKEAREAVYKTVSAKE